MKKNKILFINFCGIGNGVLLLPFLKRLEEDYPNYHYYHIENPLLAYKPLLDWLQLDHFSGMVPAGWRRFVEEDHAAIKQFIDSKGIDLIVNLRNEGLIRDHGYARFKQLMQGSAVNFVELDYVAAEARSSRHQHILEDQLDAMERHGFKLRPLPQRWLMDYLEAQGLKRGPAGEIGFFTGSKQQTKRWSFNCWLSLGRKFLQMDTYDIVIYAGVSPKELQLARSIYETLAADRPDRCRLVCGLSLEAMIQDMSGLVHLVSNDTAAIHLADAMGIYCTGLYFSTNSDIWGGALGGGISGGAEQNRPELLLF